MDGSIDVPAAAFLLHHARIPSGYYNDLIAQWNFPGQCGMSFMQCKLFLQQLTFVAMTKP
jgi:hypothetical protein